MLETIIKVLTTGKLVVNSVKFLSNLLESKKQKRINKLKEAISIHRSGNIRTYSQYRLGYIDGLINALATLENEVPLFLEEPIK